MSRELQRKLKKKKKMNVKTLTLTPQNTGLSLEQLSQLQQMSSTASSLISAKDYVNAEKLCKLMLSIYPKSADAYNILGGIALQFEKYEQAAALFEKVLEITPHDPTRLNNHAIALKYLDRHEEALKQINKSLGLKKNFVEAINNKGSILAVMGRMEQALACFQDCIRLKPDFGKPYYSIASLHKFTDGDRFSELFRNIEPRIKDLPFEDQTNFYYAFGKYYEDIGEFKKGFNSYSKANQHVKSSFAPTNNASVKIVQKMDGFFPAGGNWCNAENVGYPSDIPIFILGMPRSGTTLIEQILASHPKVHGAGELALIDDVMSGFPLNSVSIFPENSDAREKFERDLYNRGRRYSEAMQSLAPQSRHIIDKMPGNFKYIGALHLILPHAKIIHCKRDPIDTCLSNFRTFFGQNLDYTYDLEDIGRYYVAYSELMEHWARTLPGRFLEVQYENVVEDIESEAKRIVQYCDLEWDPACLKFYEAKRNVHTASMSQVRKPIYNNAIGRWQKYGELLDPLIEALEPVLKV